MNPGDVVQIDPRAEEYRSRFMILTHHCNGVVAGIVYIAEVGQLDAVDAVMCSEDAVRRIGPAAWLPSALPLMPAAVEALLAKRWGAALDDAISGLATAGIDAGKLERLRPHLQRVIEAERVQVVTDPAWPAGIFHVQLKGGVATVRIAGKDDSGARSILQATQSIRARHDMMRRLLAPAAPQP